LLLLVVVRAQQRARGCHIATGVVLLLLLTRQRGTRTWNPTRCSQGISIMGGVRICARKGHLLASAASSLLVEPFSGRSAVRATTPAQDSG
jgi:hypothetical protein